MAEQVLEKPATQPPTYGSPGLGNFMADMNRAEDGPLLKIGESAPLEPETSPEPPQEPPKTAQDAPKEAKPPETAPAAEDDSKWPRSAKDWDAFKLKRKEKETALAAERDAIRQERDKLTAELAEARKGGAPVAELESIRKERDEYSEKLRLVAVENHPKFKSYFDGKKTAQLEMAARIVGSEYADKIKEVLNLPEGSYKDGQLEEISNMLPGLRQSQLGGVINNLEALRQEREQAIADARTNYERMTAEEANQKKAKAETLGKQFTAAFSEAMTKAESEWDVFKTKANDDEWNKGVTERKELAKKLIFNSQTITMPEVSRLALQAAAFPAIHSRAQALEKQVGELTEQIKALKASNPGVGSTHSAPAGGNQPAIKSGSSPAQAIGAWAAAMRQE